MSQQTLAIELARIADELNRLAIELSATGDWTICVTRSTNAHEAYQISLRDGRYQVQYVERLIMHDVLSSDKLDDVLYDATLTTVQNIAARQVKQPFLPAKEYSDQTFPLELTLLAQFSEAWVARREIQQAAEKKRFAIHVANDVYLLRDDTSSYLVSSELQRVSTRPRTQQPDERAGS